MCGIFGIINYGNITYSKAESYRNAVRALLVASQIRGTDASGICVVTQDRTAVFKDRVRAEFLIRQANYSNIVGQIHQSKGFRVVIGHTRSQTKGNKKFNVNNHPIIAGDIIGVHNGMISNDDALFDKYKDKIQRAGRVDSEIIFRLIDMLIKEGKSTTDATKETIGMIFGSANCAFINTKNLKYVTIFSGYGVPVWIYGHVSTMVFASSKEILGRATREAGGVLNPQYRTGEFEVAGGLSRIDTDTGKVYNEKVDGFGWGNHPHEGRRNCNNCQLSSYGCDGDEAYCSMVMYGGM